jgi:hypothetical protein
MLLAVLKQIMQPADLIVFDESETKSLSKTCSLSAITVKKRIHVSKVIALGRVVHEINEVPCASHTSWYVCTIKSVLLYEMQDLCTRYNKDLTFT